MITAVYDRYCVMCGKPFQTIDPGSIACCQAHDDEYDCAIMANVEDVLDDAYPKALVTLQKYGLKIPEHKVTTSDAQIKERGVYFIQAGDSGPIKIGISEDIQFRLRELQVASPESLRLLASVEGDRETEKGLHARFSAYWRSGEWFDPVPELLEFIHGANAC